MARTIVQGVYIQDTAAGDGATSTINTRVKSVIWTGFTDAAHTLQIKNGAGTIIVPAFACGAAASAIGPITFYLNKVLRGVETDVLGSGTVTYILG